MSVVYWICSQACFGVLGGERHWMRTHTHTHHDSTHELSHSSVMSICAQLFLCTWTLTQFGNVHICSTLTHVCNICLNMDILVCEGLFISTSSCSGTETTSLFTNTLPMPNLSVLLCSYNSLCDHSWISAPSSPWLPIWELLRAKQ